MVNKNLESMVNDVDVVVTDIHGTICPQSMIPTVMNDFAQYGTDYVLKHSNDITVRKVIEKATKDAKITGSEKDVAQAVVKHVKNEIDNRRFSIDYLDLCGKVNVEGYQSGRLKSTVCPDVADAFKEWKKNGKGIYVYSNGSEDSSKWLLKSSDQGDLSQYVSGYFDTSIVGDKTKGASYRRIAESVKTNPDKMAFTSDLVTELNGAAEAKYKYPILVKRSGNKEQPKNNYRAVESFTEI